MGGSHLVVAPFSLFPEAGAEAAPGTEGWAGSGVCRSIRSDRYLKLDLATSNITCAVGG